jgi:hypothetical protein
VGAPIYHWTAHRIVSRVKLCVLALPLERAAEIRAGDTQRDIRPALEELMAVRAHPRPPAIVADSPMAVDARAKRGARKYRLKRETRGAHRRM